MPPKTEFGPFNAGLHEYVVDDFADDAPLVDRGFGQLADGSLEVNAGLSIRPI